MTNNSFTNSGGQEIIGTPDADGLSGTQWADTIIGGGDNDTIKAGAGDDCIDGDGDTGGNGGGYVYQEFVLNGSFEQVADGSGDPTMIETFNSNGDDVHDRNEVGFYQVVPGWQTDFDSIEIHGDQTGIANSLAAHDGNFKLEIDGGNASGFDNNMNVYQDVQNLVDGETYKLSWFMQNRDGDWGDVVTVTFGGVEIAVIEQTSTNYEGYEFKIQGGMGDGSDRLEFKISVCEEHAIFIDSVSIWGPSAVPVPDVPGDDLIYAQEGNDKVSGNEGDDTIFGGDGNDSLNGDEGNDVMDGGAGNDWMGGDEGNDTMSGGDGNDDMVGDAGDDVMDGGAGDDFMAGGDGNDAMSGGEGDDRMRGGEGDDKMQGGEGDDAMAGGNGDDTVFGDNRGDDECAPGGNDLIVGGTGNDELYGQGGDDTVSGDDGNDLVDGGIGDDLLSGGAGNDTISGDGGVSDGVIETDINQGTNGTYDISGVDCVTVTMDFLGGSAGFDNTFGFYIADSNGDPISGEIIKANVKTSDAAQGVDIISFTLTAAQIGAATQLGFFLVPNGGALNPDLADGDAVTFADNGNGELDALVNGQPVQAQSPHGPVFFSAQHLNGDGLDHEVDNWQPGNSNWEDLENGGDNDFNDVNWQIDVAGKEEKSLNDTISGGDGDDVINGDGGDDQIDGDAGDDEIFGGVGDDTINGGDGQDSLNGDAGDDVMDGGAGDDWMGGDDGNDTMSGGDGNDDMQGDAGDDVMNGNDGDDWMSGGDGDDTMDGDDNSRATTPDPFCAEATIQNFADNGVTLSATGLDGNPATVSEDSDGIGVIGGDPVPGQINHAETGDSEILLAEFDGPIESADIMVTRLIPGEGGGEVGQWRALDADGNEVATGTFGPEIVTTDHDLGNVPGVGKFTIDGIGPFSALEFSSLPYVNGTPDGSDDSSDYYLYSIKGQPVTEPACEPGFNDTMFGGDGNDDMAGGGGDDEMFGGNGDDLMNGGIGNDLIEGGAGDDTISGDGGVAEGVIETDINQGINGTYDVSGVDCVTVTMDFLGGSAGFNNTFGFYLADGNGDPISGEIIKADVKTSDAAQGADIITFTLSAAQLAGAAQLGFFLVPNGGTLNPDLADGDAVTFADDGNGELEAIVDGQPVLAQSPHGPVFFSAQHLNGDGLDHEVDNALPGNSNWEDLENGGDNDFNDVNWQIDVVTKTQKELDDTIFGGAGDDVITGDGGDDQISGDEGDDDISGGNGDDTIDGGEGNDTLAGDDGDDAIDGGTGDDDIDGGDGNDDLSGDDGCDTIVGGAGDDTLSGGRGADVMDGGDGNDTADYSDAQGSVLVSLADGIAEKDGDGWVDSLENIENLEGSAHADLLIGDGGDNVINGGDGNDTIEGNGGADTLDGGDGINTISFSGAIDGIVAALQNNLAIVGGNQSSLENFDVVIGGDGDDSLTGDEGDNTLIGGGGNDDIRGLEGNDLLIGDGAAASLGDENTLIVHAHGSPLDGVFPEMQVSVGGVVVGTSFVTESLTPYEFDLSGLTDAEKAGEVKITMLNDATDGGDCDNSFGPDGNEDRNLFVEAIEYNGGITDASEGVLTFDPDVFVSYQSGANNFNITDIKQEENNSPGLPNGGNVYHGSVCFAALPVFIPTPGPNDDFLAGNEGDDTMYGGVGNDTVFGGDGDDCMEGNDGDDLVCGFEGEDKVFGGAGNDTVEGNLGNDTVFGGDGDDIANGSEGDDTVHGDAGNDTVSGGDGTDIVFGGLGNDSVTGDGGDDEVSGGEGDDTVRGNLGNDTLFGGDGNDSMLGEDGDDQINGDAGNDTLKGGAGSDLLDGGLGADFLDGGLDADKLLGGEGGDVLRGGDGDDKLDGGVGIDVVKGDAGDDIAFGGADDDFVDGGDGNDTVNGGDGNDSAFGGNGDDEVHGDAGDDTVKGQAGNDTVHGGLGNDFIETGTEDDIGFGDEGDDTIRGDGGIDKLFGGTGADVLRGGAEGDFLSGGEGDDFLVSDAGDDVVDGDEGADSLRGAGGDDTLNGGAGDDNLRGNVGNDELNGGDGNDFADGEDGDDVIFGGFGNDVLRGNDGADTIEGGEGNDQLRGGLDGDKLSGGAGNDFINADGGADEVFGGDGDDDLFGAGGNDTIFGGDGIDKVKGDAGADVLDGGAGDDQVLGGDGNDAITGGDGNDDLRGNVGFDTLSGGNGSDTLIGGANQKDFYEFERRTDLNANDDVIIDNNGNNVLDVNGVLSIAELAFTQIGTSTSVNVAFIDGSGSIEFDIDAIDEMNLNSGLITQQLGFAQNGSDIDVLDDLGNILFTI